MFTDLLFAHAFVVSDRRTDIKLDPRTGCLALPVIPDGRLQFYNPERDSVLATVSFVLMASIAYRK